MNNENRGNSDACKICGSDKPGRHVTIPIDRNECKRVIQKIQII